MVNNFSIHYATKILPKLPVSVSIAFIGVCKVLGLIVVLPATNAASVLFSTKAGNNSFACKQGLREGDTRFYPFRALTLLGTAGKICTLHFSAIKPKIASGSQLLVAYRLFD